VQSKGAFVVKTVFVASPRWVIRGAYFFRPHRRDREFAGGAGLKPAPTFLLQMFGEEIRRALPGELGASGVVVGSLFVEEGMAGVVPMGFIGHVARF